MLGFAPHIMKMTRREDRCKSTRPILSLRWPLALVSKAHKSRRKLEDVIFGEAAINFEEGKWENNPSRTEKVFKPDYDVVRTPAGDMQAFAESKDRPQYHYGDYISGSAVRNDASDVFKNIRTNVCIPVFCSFSGCY